MVARLEWAKNSTPDEASTNGAWMSALAAALQPHPNSEIEEVPSGGTSGEMYTAEL